MKSTVAIDVGYNADKANCVGLLFQWENDIAERQYRASLSNISPYVPGLFYKRELPCLMAIIEQINLDEVDSIIIDGYVQLPDGKKGLGAYLYEAINQKVPVIGVAKRYYRQNDENTIKVYRGQGNTPLFISAIGIGKESAAEKVKQMKGEHRIPTILKTLDRLTKDGAI